LWHYVAFLTHLTDKDEEDFSGIESYIYEKLMQKPVATDFFPIKRALCLEINKRPDDEINSGKERQVIDMQGLVENANDRLGNYMQRSKESLETMLEDLRNNQSVNVVKANKLWSDNLTLITEQIRINELDGGEV
jgi:hypothetical protein